MPARSVAIGLYRLPTVFEHVYNAEHFLVLPPYSSLDGQQEVEKYRWNTRGGKQKVDNKRWTTRGGQQEVEY